MASTYTDGLAVEIISSGDKAGSWGDVTNNNLKVLEEGISGYAEIDIDPAANTSTLNIPDGQTAYTDDSKGRSAVIKWTGNVASGTHHTVTLQVGGATATQARFTAINGLDSTHTLRITTATMAAGSAPTYLEIPNGYSAEIHIDGAVKVINSLSGLAVEKIALKNNEIISNETDDEIIIAADTVKVGDDGAATLSSNGDQDLILKTGNSTTGSITITDGSSGNIDITPNGTGEVNIAKVDIDAGAIDGTIIGAAAAEAGTFTTLAGTTSVTTPSLTAAAALGITTVSNNDITITPHGTGETVMTKVDINGGAIDGTIIGAAAAAAGTFTTLAVGGAFNADSIVLESGETISNATNEEVLINTNKLIVGDDSALTTLESNGAHELKIQTGDDTNVASILLRHGANADLDIEPHGTGTVNVLGGSLQLGTGSGSVVIGSNGAHSLTLAAQSAVEANISIGPGANGSITLATPGTGSTVLEQVSLFDSGVDTYINFYITKGSSGYGIRDVHSSRTFEIRNSTSDSWGQPYGSGMASGQGAYFEHTILSGLPTTAGNTTQAHGLGAQPRIVKGVLKLKSGQTDGGYSDEDELQFAGDMIGWDTSGSFISVYSNSTNIGASYTYSSGSGAEYYMLNTSGVYFELAVAKWDVLVRCWL